MPTITIHSTVPNQDDLVCDSDPTDRFRLTMEKLAAMGGLEREPVKQMTDQQLQETDVPIPATKNLGASVVELSRVFNAIVQYCKGQRGQDAASLVWEGQLTLGPEPPSKAKVPRRAPDHYKCVRLFDRSREKCGYVALVSR